MTLKISRYLLVYAKDFRAFGVADIRRMTAATSAVTYSWPPVHRVAVVCTGKATLLLCAEY